MGEAVTTLSALQDIRGANLGSKYSPAFYWAMCIAISEFIGIDAETTIANDLEYLTDALQRKAAE